MHYYEKLFSARHHRRCHNHSVEVKYDKSGRKEEIIFYHYNTPICHIFPKYKQFILTDRGYNTASTHKTIGDYFRYFTSMNYKLVGLYINGTYANRFKLK